MEEPLIMGILKNARHPRKGSAKLVKGVYQNGKGAAEQSQKRVATLAVKIVQDIAHRTKPEKPVVGSTPCMDHLVCRSSPSQRVSRRSSSRSEDLNLTSEKFEEASYLNPLWVTGFRTYRRSLKSVVMICKIGLTSLSNNVPSRSESCLRMYTQLKDFMRMFVVHSSDFEN